MIIRRFNKKKISLFLVLICLLFIPVSEVLAIGQITKTITIDNALREGQYEDRLTLINSEDREVVVDISAEGEISEWISFYDDDLNQIFTSTMPPGSKKYVKVIFVIPSDVPNGGYNGYITISRQNDDLGELSTSTVAITQKISRTVNIRVSDIEDIDFVSTVTPEKFDLGDGENLKLNVSYYNKGNVIIKPQVQVKIVQAKNVLYNTILLYSESEGVKPSSQSEIPVIEIPLNNLKEGKARAEITISNNGIVMHEETVKFSKSFKRDVVVGGTNSFVIMDKKLLLLIVFSLFFMLLVVYILKSKRTKINNSL